jgi:hypothetical protein
VKLAERKHYTRVAELGCCLCHRIHGPHEPGPVELHHLRSGGWGKGGYLTVMGLCIEHHRGNTGIHGLGTKAFEAHYEVTQQDLLDWVLSKTRETT